MQSAVLLPPGRVMVRTSWFVKITNVNSQLHVVSDCSLAPIVCKSVSLQQSFHNIYVVNTFIVYFSGCTLTSLISSCSYNNIFRVHDVIFPTYKTTRFITIFMFSVNVLDRYLCAESG